jgi:tetratricopeptide (TPR) repeat protein
VRELLGLLGLGLVTHALALWLIFPGYYRPLWPHHSDFYIGPALVHAGFSLSDFMHLPRPTGALFLALIGHFGINGAMLAALVVVISNLVLLASLIRRALKLPLTFGFFVTFAGYTFLVFAHPYFYRFATYDGVAQFSLLLLLLAAGCWLRSWGQWSPVSAAAAFALCLLSFLSKETYGLSALAVAALVGLKHWRAQRSIALVPFLSLGLALLLAIWVNYLNSSPFTGAANFPDSPYRIDFSPPSLFGQYIQYARAGLNGITTGALVLTVVLTLVVPEVKKYRAALLLPLLAGALAILPNSALPNHFDAGYSWGAIALLYMPLMLMPLLIQRWGYRSVACGLSVLALLGMVHHGPGAGSQWVLEQEARQRRLIKDLRPLITDLSALAPAQHILVTGINFPFSPFDHALALRELGLGTLARFDVVSYFGHSGGVPAIPQLDRVDSGVRVLMPNEVALQTYDQVWVFRNDGSLVQRALRHEYPALVQAVPALPGINPLVYPPLLDARLDEKGANLSAEQGFRLLNLGSALLGYENLEAAQYYLQRSYGLIPDNPYPAYFLGVSYEKQGSLSEALRWFERAVETDDRQNPNPAFAAAVSRATQNLSKAE